MTYRLTLGVQLGAAYSGLAGAGLTAKLFSETGSQVGSNVTTGFVEIVAASGHYSFDYSSYPDGFRGTVAYYNGATYLKAFDFVTGPNHYENLDAKVSTRSSHSVADIWNAATSGLTTAGSVGKRLADNLDATVSGVAAAVWTVLTSTLTAANTIGKRLADNVDAAISSRGTSTLTSGQAENAVLNATASAHNTAGTIGEAINASGGGGGGSGATVDAIWNEPWAAHQTSGSFGELFTEIGSLSVIRVQAPVVQVGTTITLDRSADYFAADGRALIFTDEGNTWPTLTSATITMKVRRRGSPLLPWPGTVIVGTGSNKQVRFELSAAQTSALDVTQGLYDYRVDAVLSGSGHLTPLAEGHLAARDLAE